MPPDCIYCGWPAGAFDEHTACANAAASAAVPLTAVDLFAGPGGWDIAARALGFEPIGVEWDDNAVATRLAAGLPTIHADVAALDPCAHHPLDVLIASPPCQAFSSAGRGRGRGDVDAIMQCARDLAAGRDTRHQLAGELAGAADDGSLFGSTISDARALLVVEPLRWAFKLRPTYIACEQVPPVLPLWELFAELLQGIGYSTWTGILSAEQYGVPQTRKRAIMLASLAGPVSAPPATHTAYAKGKPRQSGDLLPWVSMADALGWDSAGAVGFPRQPGTRARDAADPLIRVGDQLYRERDLRLADEPAFVLTEKARSWSRFDTTYVAGRQTNAARRAATEPAPTIAYGHAACDAAWVPTDAVDELATQRRVPDWPNHRPATTVAGDPRVHPPGHKLNQADRDAGRDGYEGRAGKNAIRVTAEEAAALQTFPADWPWRGTRSKVFQQIGNAIPPVLAQAVLTHLLASTTTKGQ